MVPATGACSAKEPAVHAADFYDASPKSDTYKSGQKLMQDAVALAKQGKHKQAIELYQKALKSMPRNTSLHCSLAESYAAQGEATKALEHYKLARAFEPDSLNAWLGEGNALFQLARYKDAKVALNRALKLHPNDPAALAALSKIAEKTNDKKLASDYSKRAVKSARTPLERALIEADTKHSK